MFGIARQGRCTPRPLLRLGTSSTAGLHGAEHTRIHRASAYLAVHLPYRVPPARRLRVLAAFQEHHQVHLTQRPFPPTPSLTHLSTCNIPYTDALASAVRSAAPNLTSLTIASNFDDSDEIELATPGLCHLITTCAPGLTSLTFTHVLQTVPQPLADAIATCTRLQHLSYIIGEEEVAQNFPQEQSVLRVTHALHSLPSFRSLDFMYCCSGKSTAVAAAIASLTQLTCLSLTGAWTRYQPDIVRPLRNLVRLTLDIPVRGKAEAQQLAAELPQLTYLCVQGYGCCCTAPYDGPAQRGSMPLPAGLRELQLSSEVEPRELLALQLPPGLTRLGLWKLRVAPPPPFVGREMGPDGEGGASEDGDSSDGGESSDGDGLSEDGGDSGDDGGGSVGSDGGWDGGAGWDEEDGASLDGDGPSADGGYGGGASVSGDGGSGGDGGWSEDDAASLDGDGGSDGGGGRGGEGGGSLDGDGDSDSDGSGGSVSSDDVDALGMPWDGAADSDGASDSSSEASIGGASYSGFDGGPSDSGVSNGGPSDGGASDGGAGGVGPVGTVGSSDGASDRGISESGSGSMTDGSDSDDSSDQGEQAGEGQAGRGGHVGQGGGGGAAAPPSAPSPCPGFDELLEAVALLHGRFDGSKGLTLQHEWEPSPMSWPTAGDGHVRLFAALRPLGLRRLELSRCVLEVGDVAALVEHLPELEVGWESRKCNDVRLEASIPYMRTVALWKWHYLGRCLGLQVKVGRFVTRRSLSTPLPQTHVPYRFSS